MLLFYRWIPSRYNVADDESRKCECGSHATPKDAHAGQSVLKPCEFVVDTNVSDPHRDCAAVSTPGTHAIGAPLDQELLGPLANIRTCVMVSLCENKQSIVPQFRDTLCRGDSGLSLPQSKVVNSHTIDCGRRGWRDLEELATTIGSSWTETAEARLRSCASST